MRERELRRHEGQRMPDNSEKEQKRVLALLWLEIEREDNQTCADCDDAEPEWVSINLGVFLCTACVSIHRSLGVNVSSIRSITLDRWDRSMLKGIQQIGNARSNAIYEKHLMAGAKPTASSSSEDRRRFIVAKYVEKAFTKGEDASASLAGKEVASEVAANEHALPSPPPPTPIRLVDYFAVVGRGDLKQLAGYGMLDSTFDSVVTDRYPLSDHVDLEFPGDAIAQFCFPQDAELASSEMTPRRLAFCLTSATGVRQYVVALMFWELLKPMEVVALEAQCSNYQGNVANRDVCDVERSVSVRRGSLMKREVFSPKCIVLISHWPFVNVFNQFLCVLYRISRSRSPLPVERYIANFVSEVPLPPPGRMEVKFSIADEVLRISRPPPNALPLCNIRMTTLFECLDLNNVIALLVSVLTEQHIVICSSHWSALLDVAESICLLAFPFSWQGVYMPVLPQNLSEFVHAPVPFIAGIHSSYLEAMDVPREAVFVNLDTNEVLMPSMDTLPSLPERDLRKLLEQLQASANIFDPQRRRDASFDVAFPLMEHLEPITRFASEGGLVLPGAGATNTANAKKKASRFLLSQRGKSARQHEHEFDVDKTRMAFVRFFVSLLRRYRAFLVPAMSPNTTPNSLFDHAGFVRDAPESCRPLLHAIGETQLFERFVRDRWSPNGLPTDNDSANVKLFDDLIVAKLNRSNFHKTKSTLFLDSTKDAISNTFVVPFPNRAGLKLESYTCNGFPQLRQPAFGAIRAVEPLVKEERMQLVSTMARRLNNELMRGRVVPQFQSWERLSRYAVVIQSCYRRHVARRRFVALCDSTLLVQQRWRFLRRRRATSLVQCAARSYMTRAHQALVRLALAADVLSAALQGVVQRRRHGVRLQALHTLAASLHALACRRRVHVLRRRIVRAQALARGALQRRRYTRQRRMIVGCQAMFRGGLMRAHQAVCIDEALSSSLEQLVELWEALGTPLLARSQFCSVFGAQRSYLALFVHLDEVQRLRLRVEREQHEQHDLKAERQQLYVALRKRVTAADREQMFVRVGIAGKKRKRRLSNWVWNADADADAALSAALVLEISGADGGPSAERKRERIRQSLRQTTECSLNAVMRLSERVVQLNGELTHANKRVERLRQQNKMLLQQRQQHQHHKKQQQQQQLLVPFTRTRSFGEAGPQGYRPQFVPHR